MNSKNNRVNHDFQITYFLAGSCHTADGAYALLCDLREDRTQALAMLEGGKLRQRAKRIRAERMLGSDDDAEKLDALAEIAELNAGEALQKINETAAWAELAHIERCIVALQPLRRYSHMKDSDAHEACQMEEWRLELIKRAENFMLTAGTIPADQFATMRMHPQFESGIAPILKQMNSSKMPLLAEPQHLKLLSKLAIE